MKPRLKTTKTLLAPHLRAEVAQSKAVSPAPRTMTLPYSEGKCEDSDEMPGLLAPDTRGSKSFDVKNPLVALKCSKISNFLGCGKPIPMNRHSNLCSSLNVFKVKSLPKALSVWILTPRSNMRSTSKETTSKGSLYWGISDELRPPMKLCFSNTVMSVYPSRARKVAQLILDGPQPIRPILVR